MGGRCISVWECHTHFYKAVVIFRCIILVSSFYCGLVCIEGMALGEWVCWKSECGHGRVDGTLEEWVCPERVGMALEEWAWPKGSGHGPKTVGVAVGQ